MSCPRRFDHLRANVQIYRTVVGMCMQAPARLFRRKSRGMSRNAACLWFWAGFPPSRTIFGRFSKSGSEFWLGKISCPTVYKRRVRVQPTASKQRVIVACLRLTLHRKPCTVKTRLKHLIFKAKLFLRLMLNVVLIYSHGRAFRSARARF